jgi:two-component system, response regulator
MIDAADTWIGHSRGVPLVLVVDDDEGDRELAKRGLGARGINCRLEFATDGQEAIDYLLDPAEELPNLVLLDLKMPRLNGHEVLARLRGSERTKICPVVVFTSSSQDSDIRGCFENGANSYVRKAIEFDQYIARVQEVANYWLRVNESFPDSYA